MLKRSIIAWILALIMTLVTAASTLAISQMFAFREWADQYTGTESLMSAQDP